MKASGVSERSKASAKAAQDSRAGQDKLVAGKAVPGKAAAVQPPLAKSVAVKPAAVKPAAVKPVPKAAASAPVKAAVVAPASTPKKAASPAKPVAAVPAKTPVTKPATAPPAKAPVKASVKPAPPHSAAAAAPAKQSVAAAFAMPAAAGVQPRAPSQPQIETSHIVTASTDDVQSRQAPAPQAPAPQALAAAVVPVVVPVAVAAPAPAVAPVSPTPRPAPMMVNGRPAPISRASNKDEIFGEGDYVVYPTHGVGKVEKIAKEEIAGHHLELIHITFEENRMTLRVPVAKARSAGLRRLSTRKMFDEALAVLKGRARIKRTMWSRRAQEYEAKINSGDPISIAEVVRDLHRNAGQPDQSFSERQIYEAAMDRLAAELGALDQTDKNAALVKLGLFLKAA